MEIVSATKEHMGKLSHSKLFLGGIAVVVVLILLKKRSPATSTTTTPANTMLTTPTYPDPTTQTGSSGSGVDVTGAISSVTDQFSKTIQQIQQQMVDNQKANQDSLNSAITSVSKNYNDQLSSLQSHVDGQLSAVQTHDTKYAGVGNNGTGDYHLGQSILKGGNNVIQADMQRTQDVIKNRTAQGLDITNQIEWMHQLESHMTH